MTDLYTKVQHETWLFAIDGSQHEARVIGNLRIHCHYTTAHSKLGPVRTWRQRHKFLTLKPCRQRWVALSPI